MTDDTWLFLLYPTSGWSCSLGLSFSACFKMPPVLTYWKKQICTISNINKNAFNENVHQFKLLPTNISKILIMLKVKKSHMFLLECVCLFQNNFIFL